MSAGKTSGKLSKESYIDFSAIFNKYKRHWWLFAISIVACLALSVLYLYVKKPTYWVYSSVIISDDNDSGGKGASLLKNFSLGGGGASVDDELIVMNSHELRMKIAKELKTNCTYLEKTGFLKKKEYYHNSPIEVSAPDQLFDTLLNTLKFKINIDDKGKDIHIVVKEGLFKTLADVTADKFPVIVKTSYGIYSVNATKFYHPGKDLNMTAIVTGYVPVAEYYDVKLQASLQSKKSNGISLSILETNIERGKDVLNKLNELYNKRCQAEKDETAINTGKFIDDRLMLIYNELSTSEAEIEKYKQANGMADMSTDVQTIYQRRGSAENAQVQLETQYSILNMIRDFVKDPSNNGSLIPFNADFSSAGDAIKAYNELILQKMSLEKSAKSNNVILLGLNEQIDAIRKNMISSINKNLDGMRIRLNEAKSQNSLAQNQLGGIPKKEREFRELYRQQSIKNELYTFLLQKREENALVLAATTPKGKIVDNAYSMSEPESPNKVAVLLFGLIAGIFLPVIIFYFKNLFTTKFATQEELEGLVNVPVLGEICHNRHRSTLVVKEGKTSSIVELFRLLRNNIQFMLPSAEDNVILVTSSVSGEGKSFVSLNLAASFALLGKKVALVGMDIRSPKLADYLSMKSTPGVTSYLAKNDVTIGEIVQHSTEVEGLDVYVGGPIPPNPSELLLTKRVEELVKELKAGYDYVIIDSAPIAMVSDTFSLGRYTNAIVYVTRSNYTKRNYVKYMSNTVERGQLKNVALVLNDSNPQISQGYGYGYGEEKK